LLSAPLQFIADVIHGAAKYRHGIGCEQFLGKDMLSGVSNIE